MSTKPPPRASFRLDCERLVRRVERRYGDERFDCFFDQDSVPRPYLIALERRRYRDPRSLLEDYSAAIQYVRRHFTQRFGAALRLDRAEDPLLLLVFDDPALGERVSAPARQRHRAASLTLPDSPGAATDDPFGQLGEQVVRQLLDVAARRPERLSPWVVAGIAESYAGLRRRFEPESGVSFELDTFRPLAAAAVRAMRGDAARPSVRELVGASGVGTHILASSDPRFRSYAWALTEFLRYADGGSYRDRYHSFLSTEVSGTGGASRFERIFALRSRRQWDEFDECFERFVLNGFDRG